MIWQFPRFNWCAKCLAAKTAGQRLALLTSSICLSFWYVFGNYQYWAAYLTDETYAPGGATISPAVAALFSTILLLGIVPIAVVRYLLREPLTDYGIRWGNLRFALVCSVLAAPLLVLIGYFASLSPAFRAFYPVDPSALRSISAFAIHLAEQIAFYAAWEFHFRGFLQQALKNTSGLATAICVQTLVSTLAHFGKPAHGSIRRHHRWADLGRPWPGARDRSWREFFSTGFWGRASIILFFDRPQAEPRHYPAE